jgi:trehalose 6-phosphate phosphatase
VRNLVAPSAQGVLRRLAGAETLVVLDFDGTLARIAPDRRKARLSEGTRRVLQALALRYPVAILTGRSIDDVLLRLGGVPVRWVVGSHGAEWPGETAPRAWRRLVASWRRELDRRLAGDPEIDVEDKGLSLSLHWRNAARPRAAGATARRVAAGLPGAALVPGKRVLNLSPEAAGDKGTALRRLLAESRAARVIFVGDDVTDELAFRARLRGGVMVRVGRSASSAARWFVPRRDDVDRLLLALVRLRQVGAERRWTHPHPESGVRSAERR